MNAGQSAEDKLDKGKHKGLHCRAARKQEKDRETKRKRLGLSDDVKLLPEAEEDRLAASLVQFGDSDAFRKKWQQSRRSIKNQSIFAPSAIAKKAARTPKSLLKERQRPRLERS